MASFHVKASKKVEELDEGAEVEDPACVVGYVREGMYHFSVSCITLGGHLWKVIH